MRTLVPVFLFALVIGLVSGCGDSGGFNQSSDALGLTGPALQGTPPTVRVIPGSPTTGTNQSIPVVFAVFDRYGVPCPNSTKIVVGFDNGGKLDDAEPSTTDGFAQALYTAGPNAGVERMTAAALGALGSATVTILANPPARPLVRVALVVDQVRPGESVPIVVFVSNSSGSPVSTDVKMYALMGGTFNPDHGTSDGGVFATSYTASTTQGVDLITAIAGGSTATASLAVLP